MRSLGFFVSWKERMFRRSDTLLWCETRHDAREVVILSGTSPSSCFASGLSNVVDDKVDAVEPMIDDCG